MARSSKKSDETEIDLGLIIEAAALEDDGSVARAHLAAGRAIYYGDDDTPAGYAALVRPHWARTL